MSLAPNDRISAFDPPSDAQVLGLSSALRISAVRQKWERKISTLQIVKTDEIFTANFWQRKWEFLILAVSHTQNWGGRLRAFRFPIQNLLISNCSEMGSKRFLDDYRHLQLWGVPSQRFTQSECFLIIQKQQEEAQKQLQQLREIEARFGERKSSF